MLSAKTLSSTAPWFKCQNLVIIQSIQFFHEMYTYYSS